MKMHNLLATAFVATWILAGVALVAATSPVAPAPHLSQALADDTLPGLLHDRLPGETAPDTTPYRGSDYQGTPIRLTARAYGDSVVLRWAPAGYAAWTYLNRVGYNVYRYDSRHHCDTLALALRPKPLDVFRARYGDGDSIARVGYGLIYGDNVKKPDATREEAGSMGSMLEVYDDQVTSLAFAVLVSEWRQDVAEDMAMRFTDRHVTRGETYDYIIQPAVTDTTGSMMIVGGQVRQVENVAYRPVTYQPHLRDSVSDGLAVTLWWDDRANSSFEIERRVQGSQRWERVNRRTYLPMFKSDLAAHDDEVMYVDHVPQPGTYEYRVLAHDAFGDTTEPSAPLTVKVGDKQPPSAPVVTAVHIARPDTAHPTARVLATIRWRKDSLEADLAGYMPLYYNERFTGKEWKPLCQQQLTPGDTTVTVDVTGLATGMLVVAAYDESGNAGYSLPVELRISDMKAPDAPGNLRAEVDDDNGTITLRWDKPADDDVAYYELAFANDTTHHYLMRNQGQIRDTLFVDTVQMNVNQRFIYYKVRAVDYSNNTGEYSDILQVERPHITPPTTAHLDSAWVDDEGIHMNWVTGLDADMYYHHLFRRQEGDKTWDLIAIVTAEDVLRANEKGVLQVVDQPPIDNTRRYEYVVVSYNHSEIASEPSLVYSVLRADLRDVDARLKLMGTYDAQHGETRLSWDSAPIDAHATPFDYCVYRRGADDRSFRFLMTVPSDTPMHTDYLLSAGETASYYVVIRFADGHRSLPSNTVDISAPTENDRKK